MSDVYGKVRSISANWVASDIPAVGGLSYALMEGTLFIPMIGEIEPTLKEGEIENLLATVPAGLFPRMAVQLYGYNGGRIHREIEVLDDHVLEMPAWLAWSLSHNSYLSHIRYWAKSFASRYESKKTGGPLSELWSLRFRGDHFTDVVKQRPSYCFQRPLSNFTSHRLVSEAFLGRHVNETWTRDYLTLVDRIDDGFEAFDGQYLKKSNIYDLAQHVIEACDEFIPKLYPSRNRPLPLITELSSVVLQDYRDAE